MRHERNALPAAVPHEGWLLEQLKDAEFAAEYLNAALAEGEQAAFMLALRDVAKARGGVTAVSRLSGMNRVALSRALSAKGNPELRSLTKILDASGVRIQFVARGSRRGAVPRAPRTAARRAA